MHAVIAIIRAGTTAMAKIGTEAAIRARMAATANTGAGITAMRIVTTAIRVRKTAPVIHGTAAAMRTRIAGPGVHGTGTTAMRAGRRTGGSSMLAGAICDNIRTAGRLALPPGTYAGRFQISLGTCVNNSMREYYRRIFVNIDIYE